MKGPVIKTCEACGRTFECGQWGCWCGRIEVTERQMDWIAARFQDCLCPDCLTKVTQGDESLAPRRQAPDHGQSNP